MARELEEGLEREVQAMDPVKERASVIHAFSMQVQVQVQVMSLSVCDGVASSSSSFLQLRSLLHFVVVAVLNS